MPTLKLLQGLDMCQVYINSVNVMKSILCLQWSCQRMKQPYIVWTWSDEKLARHCNLQLLPYSVSYCNSHKKNSQWMVISLCAVTVQNLTVIRRKLVSRKCSLQLSRSYTFDLEIRSKSPKIWYKTVVQSLLHADPNSYAPSPPPSHAHLSAVSHHSKVGGLGTGGGRGLLQRLGGNGHGIVIHVINILSICDEGRGGAGWVPQLSLPFHSLHWVHGFSVWSVSFPFSVRGFLLLAFAFGAGQDRLGFCASKMNTKVSKQKQEMGI